MTGKSLRRIGLAAMLVLPSCAGPRLYVAVDSILDPDAGDAMTFTVRPGDPEVSPRDLHFKEIAAQVRTVLEARGMKHEAERPEVVVYLRYGLGAPETLSYLTSTPVYGYRGGGYSSFSKTEVSSDTTKRTFGSVYEEPRYELVGSETRSQTVTLYRRYLVIEAARPGAGGPATDEPVWKTTVTSRGDSDDLRLMLPIMLKAAEPFIGGNTGRQVLIAVDDEGRGREVRSSAR